jgi:hypothetical protein
VLFGRIGGARRCKPTVQFLLDQYGVFQQSNDFGPDDLIEKILAESDRCRKPDHTVFASSRNQYICSSGFCVRSFA